MKMHLKISSAKWRPFCLGGDELISISHSCIVTNIYQRLTTKCWEFFLPIGKQKSTFIKQSYSVFWFTLQTPVQYWCTIISIAEEIKVIFFFTREICLNKTEMATSVLFQYKDHISRLMGYCKKDITPLLTRWGYIFLALTHRDIRFP